MLAHRSIRRLAKKQIHYGLANLLQREPDAASYFSTRSYKNCWKPGKYKKEELEEELRQINERLAEAEKEKYGKFRGLDAIRKQLQKELPPDKTLRPIKDSKAEEELCRLVSTRHALLNGAKRLQEFRPRQLAQTLLGPESEQTMVTPDARLILMQLWRRGESVHLNSFKKKEKRERKRLGRLEKALEQLNNFKGEK